MRRLLITLLLIASPALGMPYQLTYSGRLTEASGAPVTGPIDMTVAFYRSANGNDRVTGVTIPGWSGVQLDQGVFQVTLTLSAADFHIIFNELEDAWIEVTNLTHGKTYPRQKFTPVPYALKVPVDGESITYNIDGNLTIGNPKGIGLKTSTGSQTVTIKPNDATAADFTFRLPVDSGATGKVLKSDGAGNTYWGDDVSGGGAGSITSTEIQDNSITNDDIAGGAAIVTSKLSGAVTAISGHGLGTAASVNTGTTSGTVPVLNASNKLDTSLIDTGTGANQVVQLDSNGKLPALDASALTNVPNSFGTSIESSEITDGTIESVDIKDGTITTDDIASDTITNADISSSAAIATSKLSGAVTSISNHGLGFIGARVRLANSSGRVTLNTSSPAIVFDTEEFDSDGFFNSGTSNTRFYIPSGKGGYYMVGASILTGQNPNASVRLIRIRKNGSDICGSTIIVPTNELYQLQCSTLINLAQGDYVDVAVYSTQSIASIESTATNFWLTKIGH